MLFLFFLAPQAVTLTKDGDLSFFSKQDEVCNAWNFYNLSQTTIF